MSKHLFYFRPGEEARMLARCQFGGAIGRGFGATFTYPIQGHPWRNNIRKSYELVLNEENQKLLFSEVKRLKLQHPIECLDSDQVWSDSSEKANGITRDREHNELCYTIGIMLEDHEPEEYYHIRENSEPFIKSELYNIISEFLSPYEQL